MIKTLQELQRRSILVLFTLLVSHSILVAQTRSVSGVVKSTDGETVPGVNVVEKGTNNGTVTNIEGKFTISLPEGAVLMVSFIGMKPMEVPVGNQTYLDIIMDTDITELQEVVVIGYGTVERRDLTSSVSSVSAKQLKDIPINSAAEALVGRLAGVQITGSEGSPDAEMIIRVRGGGSITQDNSPLFVVDGIQVENALSVLSPQDIESVDVLKDASATAIYGARGANGVVIITTKGGKEMKTTASYNGFVGVRQLANKLEVMKPYDFVNYQYERSRGSNADRNNFLNTYGHFEDMELYRGVPFVDWQDQVFGRDAVMQTHNFNISGGSKVTKFSLSATSNSEEGVMLFSDYDRKLVNFRFDHKINDRVQTGFNVRYNNTIVNGSGTATAGSSSVNRLRHSVKYRPILLPGQGVETFDPDYADQTNANSLALINPVLLSEAEYRRRDQDVSNLNGYMSFKLNDFIEFRSTIGVDMTLREDRIFNDTITVASRQQGGQQPMASIRTSRTTILNNSNVLTFNLGKIDNSFFQRHKIDALIGHEIYEVNTRMNFIENRFFPIGITPQLAFGSMSLGVPQIPTSNEERSTLLSFFTRANYTYDDKYLLAVTMRADGSSKFAQGNKWGYFPSVSGAWRISSEDFMQTNDIFSELKLRLSYGEAGNNRIPNFLYLPLFEANSFYSLNNQLIVGFGPQRQGNQPVLANSNLVWETTISKNIGLDAGIFNNRIQLSVDAYTNSTTDLLIEMPVPSTSGYTRQFQNIGETTNRGIEVQLSGVVVNKKDFYWNAVFNISFNRNRVESLGNLASFLFPSGWAGGNVPSDYIVKVGHSVGTMWGLVTDGFYTIDDFDYADGVYTLKQGIPNNQSITAIAPRPGVLKFQDINGDGIVNDDDRTIIGDATPKFFGGLNQQISYKNFDLSVFVNFQFGNDILNANKLEFSSGYTPNSNLLAMMNDRWRNVDAEGQVITDPVVLENLNRDATIWSPLTSASSFYLHSWAIEDGSFVRINNVTLGYTIPKGILDKIKISQMRFYATVNNLALFSKYSGYDPEVNTRRATPMTPGVDYAAYPRSRAFIAGVNLTF